MKSYLYSVCLLLGLASMMLTSCYRDEYLNPSQASNESVVGSTSGLISLCNGLQFRYSVSRTSPIYSTITASGLSCGELNVLNQGNTDEATLQTGKASVLGNNAVVSRLWEQNLIIKYNAELILNNIDIVGDPATRNAILCYAYLYRGLSVLQLGTFWEQAPLVTGKGAVFSGRTDVLLNAVQMFEKGTAAAAAGPVFTTAFQSGIDFANTFAALTARTYNMLGNYDKALEAANKVDLTKKSEWTYDDVSRNPIFDVSYSNVNVCEPIDFNLGLSGGLLPADTDGRILFYLKSKTFTTTANEGKGFFTANSAKIPVYLPGEVSLIKAECYARKNDLANALTELNKVLTKTNDVYGVNANLPAYAGEQSQSALLQEIYRNRCIELFNSGMKLEDSRRFNRPGPNDTGAERSRNYYPYPNSERDNNPNTPPDPAI
jgi:tetratricopeptide (TPR) repeat protein